MILSGRIQANDPDWRLIVVKNAGDKMKISLSGSWQARKGAANRVDYRGSDRYQGDSRYRGSGLPEGCMLFRYEQGEPMMFASSPWQFDTSFAGKIYLACNDVPDPDCLADNSFFLVYDIELER